MWFVCWRYYRDAATSWVGVALSQAPPQEIAIPPHKEPKVCKVHTHTHSTARTCTCLISFLRCFFFTGGIFRCAPVSGKILHNGHLQSFGGVCTTPYSTCFHYVTMTSLQLYGAGGLWECSLTELSRKASARVEQEVCVCVCVCVGVTTLVFGPITPHWKEL